MGLVNKAEIISEIERRIKELEEWLEEYVSDLASVGTDTLIGSFKRYLNGEI